MVQSVLVRRPAFRIKCQYIHSSSSQVAVVGGGVGGLVAAGLMAKQGLKVTIFEKNPEIGGRMQSVEVDGYRFDSGPSLLLYPNTYKETFELLGTKMEDHVELQRIEPAAYRAFFGDGSHLELLYDINNMMVQLDNVEPGAGAKYLDWLSAARIALDVGSDNIIGRDFTSAADVLSLAKLAPLITKIDLRDMLGIHYDRLKLRFQDPRLRALFTFQDLYVGLSPYNAPAAFSLLAATEITEGVWYPMGGFQKIRDALQSIAEGYGVQIKTNCEVSEIVVEQNQTKGLKLSDGTFFKSDAVVCNQDLPQAYSRVQQQEAQFEKYKQWEYSATVFAYYWSVDTKIEGLNHHNVFLSDEFKESWDRATNPESLRTLPNFYVHAPTQTDPTSAPEDCESIMVLLPIECLKDLKEQDQQALQEAGKRAILKFMKKAGISDFEKNIVREEVRTPTQWRDMYGLQYGSVFGLSHGLSQLALFRPALRDENVKGLYFVGASTRPGNGVPLCMLSGRLVVDRVMEDITALTKAAV
eukprot:TRINITY_DN10281_c1_g1_i1.p1 TRINITY_DN10281_c1_g1~~TRINITY_DN10281_c1_g1_i1.p1  ORF type:complete len:560 (-),score=57.27 TRINITY_DN10281_c1_g1_i1:380-1957(-)